MGTGVGSGVGAELVGAGVGDRVGPGLGKYGVVPATKMNTLPIKELLPSDGAAIKP